jgi:hypothetical protein
LNYPAEGSEVSQGTLIMVATSGGEPYGPSRQHSKLVENASKRMIRSWLWVLARLNGPDPSVETFQPNMGPILRSQDPPHFSVRRAGAAVLCFLLAFPAFAGAGQKPFHFESVRVETDSLRMDFKVDSLFNREVFRGLKKGMTAGLEYQVQLWEKRSGWFDMVIAETGIRMKIGYDNWERKFTVMQSDRTLLFMNDEEAGRHCSRLTRFRIAGMDQLKPTRAYRIFVRVLFQPMSMENVEEIRRWLSGKADDLNAKSIKRSKSPLKSAGDWLLGFVVNVSGFGDREFTAESPEFTLENGVLMISGEK